ncbi:MAG TPA: DUF2142 domain-containing protein [Candidatus Dormibacteraeota bacterium]|nr:DUF2142 domain-containing protein [Candidatus Dormibacteraeota bacterium]
MTLAARRLPYALSVGFLLLGLAWLSGPPAAGPDEPAHYLRALSVGRGDFFGRPTSEVALRPQNPAQAVHLQRTTRAVDVPAGLAVPASWFCTVSDHAASAACIGTPAPNAPATQQATYEAGYLPFLYIPDGVAMRLAGTATQAMDLARIANALVTFSLLVLAVFLLWDGSPLSLVGVPLAVTPTVLFTGTVINPSGAEIGASIALLAFLLRISRPVAAPAWVWWGGPAAAVVLSLARPLGAVWVVFLVVLAIAFGGRRTLAEALRGAPRGAHLWLPIVPGAMVLGLGWQIVAVPPLGHSFSEFAGLLGPSIAAVPEAFGEAIGVFGWQDTLMPRPAYAVWGLALVGLISPALLRGRHRERRTLDVLVVACFGAIVAVSAVIELPTGFAVQGRHVLPALMALPLVSGEILYRNRERIGYRSVARIGALVAVPAALVQFVGWYSNAHRYAVGLDGPWLFLGRSAWSPSAGWLPWIALAAIGSGLLVVAAVLPLRRAGLDTAEKIQGA